MDFFTQKYAPQSSNQVLGQQISLAELKDFIVGYKRQKQKAAVLYGPIGCGKTSSVYALAKELKYDLLEINSSEVRNEANMKSFLSAALGQQSLFFTPKLVLIDEVDNISGVHDRGCIPALLSALEKSSFPVILTANDLSDSKFSGLRKAARMIEYRSLDYTTIVQLLQSICAQEGITFEEKALNHLARRVDGDLRSALIDLQVCSAAKKYLSYEDISQLSDRKRTESILNALLLIFKSSSANNALPALDELDLELNEVFLWLDENLPKEYFSPSALAKAYEHLSRADVFNNRIRRWQHWRFLVYINNLLTAGISSAKDYKNPRTVEYKPTMRLLKIWQAKMKQAKKKEIAAKLALATHTSQKAAFHQIPYLRVMFQGGKGAEVAQELNLTEEEADWLRER